eukprot:IDg21690t1
MLLLIALMIRDAESVTGTVLYCSCQVSGIHQRPNTNNGSKCTDSSEMIPAIRHPPDFSGRDFSELGSVELKFLALEFCALESFFPAMGAFLPLCYRLLQGIQAKPLHGISDKTRAAGRTLGSGMCIRSVGRRGTLRQRTPRKAPSQDQKTQYRQSDNARCADYTIPAQLRALSSIPSLDKSSLQRAGTEIKKRRPAQVGYGNFSNSKQMMIILWILINDSVKFISEKNEECTSTTFEYLISELVNELQKSV